MTSVLVKLKLKFNTTCRDKQQRGIFTQAIYMTEYRKHKHGIVLDDQIEITRGRKQIKCLIISI